MSGYEHEVAFRDDDPDTEPPVIDSEDDGHDAAADYTLLQVMQLTSSEAADAPYNADVWELRARINWLIGIYREMETQRNTYGQALTRSVAAPPEDSRHA